MTFSGIVGLLGAFAIVLGLLLLALRFLRRFAPASSAMASTIPLAVLRRVPLGPRQSIALVQIDERVLAVAIGDGGVRLLTELDPSALRTGSARNEAGRSNAGPGASTGFGQSLQHAIRVAVQQGGRLGLALAFTAAALSATGATATTLEAQAAPARPAAVAPAVAPTAASVARLDSLLPRLAPQMQVQLGREGENGLRLSGTVGIVVMMGLLTMLPMLVLMMTGFTRILVVMHFLRQAIGAQSAPPAQLVAGLSLLLTLFVMAPTLEEANRRAITPWMDGTMEQAEMLRTASEPFREFMLAQVREQDLENFLELSGHTAVERIEDVPIIVLTSAFVTSELRTAFQIGFALFLPFIVIDLVVAAVLMSVGMMMVPPSMISLPFKLLLFVLADGWTLIVTSLVGSFA